jgi:hypothetical protein
MNKLLLAAAFVLSVAIEADGKEIQLSAGMPVSSATTILRGMATDLTPGLSLSLGSDGKPAAELCWELKDYDLVVWLYDAEDGNISALGFWTKKGFAEPLGERSRLEGTARKITLDSEKHACSIEKFPIYFPKNSVNQYEQSWYGPILASMKEPVLSATEKEKGYFAFRVLYLPGDHSRPYPRCAAVRYEKRGDHCFRRSVVLSADLPGENSQLKEVEVPKVAVDALAASLEKAGFWKLPKDDSVDVMNQLPGQEDAETKDRSRLVVEVIKEGEHRVRVRWSPWHEAEKRGLSDLNNLITKQFQEAGFWKQDR